MGNILNHLVKNPVHLLVDNLLSCIAFVPVGHLVYPFGKWDFAVLFEADTNENALHFAGDIVRPIDGVVAMRTVPLAPLRSWL